MAQLETTWLTDGTKEFHSLTDELVLESAEGRCVLRPQGPHWEALDLDERENVFLNGGLLRRSRLVHGDTLWLWDRLVRFLDRPELPEQHFEALVDATPERDGRLQVWTDALLEHGDPLGTALAESGEVALFEGLAAHLMAGHLEATWRAGLPRQVTLRMLPVNFWPEAVLAQLLSLRAARWLERITFDGHGARAPARIERPVLRLLVASRLPRTLQRFDCTYTLGSIEDDDELRALRARLRPIGYLAPATVEAAWLEVIAVRANAQSPHQVGERIDVSNGFELERFTIGVTPLGWTLVSGLFATRLNARLVSTTDGLRVPAEHRLLDGDLIESGSTRFRFRVGSPTR